MAPKRAGEYEAGYEASFLALDGNPLVDWSSLGRIRYRFKEGSPLVIPGGQPRSKLLRNLPADRSPTTR